MNNNMTVYGFTFVSLNKASSSITEDLVERTDKHVRAFCAKHEAQMRSWTIYPEGTARSLPRLTDRVDVRLINGILRRQRKASLHALFEDRLSAVREIVQVALTDYGAAADAIITQLGTWMAHRSAVRFIGAGRASLAALIPANRIAHGGAQVSALGSVLPLHNSIHDGGVIAASASGTTPAVLSVLDGIRRINEERHNNGLSTIPVIGIADVGASQFKSLCSVGHFIGIRHKELYDKVELSELADLGEYAISELLDGLVVAAIHEIGANTLLGHEDIGPTGPYSQRY